MVVRGRLFWWAVVSVAAPPNSALKKALFSQVIQILQVLIGRFIRKQSQPSLKHSTVETTSLVRRHKSTTVYYWKTKRTRVSQRL